MKLLFLASFAANTLPLLKDFLPKPVSEYKLAFIPTAADVYENKDFVAVDRNTLVEFGFKVTDVDIKNIDKKTLKNQLAKFEIIFVSGGNTFYLLEQAIKSGFDEIVKEMTNTGTIYIGSSAGTALCCPDIEYVKVFDDPRVVPNLKNYKGLNLYPNLIIPHAQQEKYLERVKRVAVEEKSKGMLVTELKDNQAIVVTDKFAKVVKI